MMQNLLNGTAKDWQPLLRCALSTMDETYLASLHQTQDWLPGWSKLLAAFRLPLKETNYILFGESPYPRAQSANGFAFWDEAVSSLWAADGLAKAVNRATSLRNWLKMLLVARGDLKDDYSKTAVAKLDKTAYWQTAEDFFHSLVHTKGFLLLNACLVYQEGEIKGHAKQWQPFMASLLAQLVLVKPQLKLILLGKIAEKLSYPADFPCLKAEHPYNLSFISNQAVIDFFKPLDLLNRYA